jgi:hypothetical protein
MSEKVLVKEVGSALPSHIDLFICAASYDSRTLSIVSTLAPLIVNKIIVFIDPGNSGAFGVDAVRYMSERFGEKVTVVEFDLANPLDIADKIVKAISNVQEATGEVVVDITTFTQEALLILLRVLQISTLSGANTTGAYTGAGDYSVGLNAEGKWLTKGVLEIRSVLGFAGESKPTQKQHLIVLAGYEVERAEKTIDAYEPALLSIGLGDPNESISKSLFDVNKWFHGKLIERYREVKHFVFSCEDSTHTKDAILKQVQDYPGYNVQIAPMNTKISTVGVALAAMEDTAIQICYALPADYNREGYTSPGDFAYVFKLQIPKEK